MIDKILDAGDIFRVTEDLEARGAKCVVNVRGLVNSDGVVGFALDSIKATFPSGRRWEIIDIETAKKRTKKEEGK